jgi:hypothetical protein
MSDIDTLDRVSNSNSAIIDCFLQISRERKVKARNVNRYLVFAHDVPSLSGGWHDLQATSDSVHEARIIAARLLNYDRYDLVYVIDLTTGFRVAL